MFQLMDLYAVNEHLKMLKILLKKSLKKMFQVQNLEELHNNLWKIIILKY